MGQGALSALLFFLQSGEIGNSFLVHTFGRKAKTFVDKSRDSLAHTLGIIDPDSILFTSGATESINTVLKGFAEQHSYQATIVSSTVEHEATLQALEYLKSKGVIVVLLAVNERGALDLAQLDEALLHAKGKVLVSLMAANNETGVIFPWEECARRSKARGASFHLDAAQALGKVSNFKVIPELDAMSVSGHKFGAAKGVGALYLKKGFTLSPLLHGGAQERKRRAGTLNMISIMTVDQACRSLESRGLESIQKNRDAFEAKLKKTFAGVSIQGEGEPRLGNTSNFLLEGVRGESLVMGLDLAGFAVSSGSACNSGSILPSHVLLAMGLDSLAARSALRVSLGPQNRAQELDQLIEAMEPLVQRIRSKKS